MKKSNTQLNFAQSELGSLDSTFQISENIRTKISELKTKGVIERNTLLS
jgi:hypothetical protein